MVQIAIKSYGALVIVINIFECKRYPCQLLHIQWNEIIFQNATLYSFSKTGRINWEYTDVRVSTDNHSVFP